MRFARDKRGYEHTYLIHASNRKGAPARILYWYRTPPGVKVGRIAFDDDVRKALELQYPSIVFDWPRLMDAPPPPPDVEHWRERRRLEKAARQARQAAERDDRPEAAAGPDHPDGADAPAGPAWTAEVPVPVGRAEAAPVPAEPRAADDVAGVAAGADRPMEGPATGDSGTRPRKRRRRGGRRRRKVGPGDPAAGLPGTQAADGLADAADGDDDGGEDGPAEGEPRVSGTAARTESSPMASDPQE